MLGIAVVSSDGLIAYLHNTPELRCPYPLSMTPLSCTKPYAPSTEPYALHPVPYALSPKP